MRSTVAHERCQRLVRTWHLLGGPLWYTFSSPCSSTRALNSFPGMFSSVDLISQARHLFSFSLFSVYLLDLCYCSLCSQFMCSIFVLVFSLPPTTVLFLSFLRVFAFLPPWHLLHPFHPIFFLFNHFLSFRFNSLHENRSFVTYGLVSSGRERGREGRWRREMGRGRAREWEAGNIKSLTSIALRMLEESWSSFDINNSKLQMKIEGEREGWR